MNEGKQDTSHITALIQLAKYQVKKPGEFKADLDSAESFLAKAAKLNAILKDDRSTAMLYLVNSYLYQEKKEDARGKQLVEQAINKFKTIDGVNSLIGESYLQLSQFYPLSGSDVKYKESAVKDAIHYYHLAGNPDREEYCLSYLGDIEMTNGDNTDALIHEKQALAISKKFHLRGQQAIYNVLSLLYVEAGDYKGGIDNELTAVKIAEAEKDSSELLVSCYNRLAIIYSGIHEEANAVIYLKKAIPAALKIHDYIAVAIIGSNLGRTMVSLHRSAEGLNYLNDLRSKNKMPNDHPEIDAWNVAYLELYTDLKKLDAAQKTADELISEISTHDEPERRVDYFSLINFFVTSRQFKLASKYIQLDKQLPSMASRNGWLLKLAHEEFQLDSAKSNYKDALSDLLKYNSIKDSLYSEAKAKQIAALELQYETEKKEAEIKFKDQNIYLLTQRSQIETLTLKRSNMVKDIAIISGILLLAIALLMYYLYRSKQTANGIITEKNQSMQQLLEEMKVLLGDKEVLLREIHHRVKNNLHMVSSLLESQSAYLENEALVAVQKSQHRIQAISILHQKLYLSNNLTVISMSVYLREIISYLKESFAIDGNKVFVMDIDPLDFDAVQALPVGLIVNEAITNSLKYAFPNDRQGVIHISLKNDQQPECKLCIKDNGVGFSQALNDNYTNSLGLSLIKGLSKTLDGKLTVNSSSGTEIKVAFTVSQFYR